MAPRAWFPEVLEGRKITLRRHVPENLAAFRRWYADPEIARLARYQEAPMRSEEIERFFAARVVGPEAMAMAIHEASTGRLLGTCAFSQMDGDNGSALYHITIGEKDAWGLGYGTEAAAAVLAWIGRERSQERTVALIHARNAKSLHIAGKLGYRAFDRRDYRGYPAVLVERLLEPALKVVR